MKPLISAILLSLVFSCSSLSPLKDSSELIERSMSSSTVWPFWGGNLNNSHYMDKEKIITRENVHRLKVKWKLPLQNSVATIPAYSEGVLYFMDLAPVPTGMGGAITAALLPSIKSRGNLNAVDANTGKLLWSRSIRSYSGSQLRSATKNTPAIWGDQLIFGDSTDNVKFMKHGVLGKMFAPGASIYSVNQKDGKLKWKTLVDKDFSTRITQSPVVYDGVVYVGLSSEESQIPGIRAFLTKNKGQWADFMRYDCCQFRGAMLALDANTGKILWRTDMIPAPPPGVKPDAWFSGAAIWGSSPSIDLKRSQLYIATGNNYNTPKDLKQCLNSIRNLDGKGASSPEFKDCVDRYDHRDNLFDAIVALDLKTGRINWSYKSSLFDAWNVSCGKDLTKIPPEDKLACPSPYGKDYDFGQAPMILHNVVLNTSEDNGKTVDLVVAGQKSGTFYAINADTGELVWKTQSGPGGELGGHELGSATNGKYIFTQMTNLNHYEYVLRGKYRNHFKAVDEPTNGGFWSALDPTNGEIVWQTSDPSSRFSLLPAPGEKGIKSMLYKNKYIGLGQLAAAFGPMTATPGLVWAGSIAKGMYAFDSDTGKILWSFDSEGSIASAPTIVQGVVYWGSGYSLGIDSKTFYAFSIDGK